jgi:hypothetical protein
MTLIGRLPHSRVLTSLDYAAYAEQEAQNFPAFPPSRFRMRHKTQLGIMQRAQLALGRVSPAASASSRDVTCARKSPRTPRAVRSPPDGTAPRRGWVERRRHLR